MNKTVEILRENRRNFPLDVDGQPEVRNNRKLSLFREIIIIRGWPK